MSCPPFVGSCASITTAAVIGEKNISFFVTITCQLPCQEYLSLPMLKYRFSSFYLVQELNTGCLVSTIESSLLFFCYFFFIAGDTFGTEQNFKTCFPTAQCLNGSINLGSARVTVSTLCCQTDNCNTGRPTGNVSVFLCMTSQASTTA